MFAHADINIDTAMLGKFYRIANDIKQNLFKVFRVSGQSKWHLGVNMEINRDTFFNGMSFKHCDQALQQLVQIKRLFDQFKLSCFNFCHIKNSLDQAKKVVSRFFNDNGKMTLLFSQSSA